MIIIVNIIGVQASTVCGVKIIFDNCKRSSLLGCKSFVSFLWPPAEKGKPTFSACLALTKGDYVRLNHKLHREPAF